MKNESIIGLVLGAVLFLFIIYYIYRTDKNHKKNNTKNYYTISLSFRIYLIAIIGLIGCIISIFRKIYNS